jgi:hypothetical protein
MEINTATTFLKDFISQTDKKSEIRLYTKFISVLTDLEAKALTKDQIQSIEKELDTINFSTSAENRKKHLSKSLTQLIRFLQKNLSLITEGHYVGIGMSLGMCFGVAFGAAFSNVSYGLLFGMLIGLMAGGVIETKAKKEGKLLNTNLYKK